MNRILPTLALYALLFPAPTNAQAPLAPVTDLDSAAAAHYQAHPNELPIYNGRQHLGYGLNILGDAYFKQHDWQTGSVLFDGNWYSGLPLKYDLSADQVIVQGLNLTGATMNRDRITEFWLGTTHFVRNNFDLRNLPAFYESMVEGKIQLIAFHKRIYEIDLDVKPSFRYVVQYFAVVDGKIVAIKKKRDLLRLFGDKRKQAAANFRASGIEFRQNKEAAMIHLVRFYNN